MKVMAPKFEAVFNCGGKFFRLLQDSFHPAEYVDGLIAERYATDGEVTYIIDDALVHYMKMSFKRLKEGRRDKFPNYEIIGLSRSGFTPYDIPKSKVGCAGAFKACIECNTVVCGSTQLKRKMVLGTMLDLKQKFHIKETLFFIAYSDEMLSRFAEQNNLPVALMAADMVGPMAEYFGNWYDWYYLRSSHQDKVNLALVNSRTLEISIPHPCKAGIGDHSFFKRNTAVEDWIATHTSLSSGQTKNVNVQPDFSGDIEVFLDGVWQPKKDVDINWGGLGRGRDDSFGLCESAVDYGPFLTLRVKTSVNGVFFCGIFARYGYAVYNGVSKTYYTPLPVKNQETFNRISSVNNLVLS